VAEVADARPQAYVRVERAQYALGFEAMASVAG
jgi:hypothetical protein